MAGWITINGTHIYIKDGEDVAAAFERTTGQKLEGKGNPNQSSKSKPFRLQDVIEKERENRITKNMDKMLDAKDDGDKYEQGKYQERASAADKEISESERLTEKGAEARKAREEKKADKELDEEATLIAAEEDIKKDSKSQKEEKNSKQWKSAEEEQKAEQTYHAANNFGCSLMLGTDGNGDAVLSDLCPGGEEVRGTANIQARLDEILKNSQDVHRAFEKTGHAETTDGVVARDYANQFNRDQYNGWSNDRIKVEKQGDKYVLNHYKSSKQARYISLDKIPNTVNDNIRAAAGRTAPKLGAPERGNILSVGTYKGYSIDKDIYGGKGVTVNIDGDEAVFNSPEEAMREIDSMESSRQAASDNIRAAAGRTKAIEETEESFADKMIEEARAKGYRLSKDDALEIIDQSVDFKRDNPREVVAHLQFEEKDRIKKR